MSTRLKTLFIPVWKEAPLIRFLVPLIIGIICQWYLSFSNPILIVSSIILFFTTMLLYQTKYKSTYRLGLVFFIACVLVGCWLVVLKDPRNWNTHVAKHYQSTQTVIATLQEPVVKKGNNYKTIASIQLLDSNGNKMQVTGNIIMYVAVDSLSEKLQYGSILVFKKQLVSITNSGNPGGFDYKRYAAFNNLFYQVFLKKAEYVVTGVKDANAVRKMLFVTRQYAIDQFRKSIPNKTEAGMAEALLLGYKGDLDKQLVESYANTGVVHIIAISGMHLGLIYGLLFFVLQPLEKRKHGRFIKGLIIITALWLFSILTGAAPSITRSAIMFSIIVAGSSFGKTTTIYNSLAVSAVALLVYNPFNLWDVGFQLSYAALLSIAVLGDPLTKFLYVPNKWLQKIVQLLAITTAAQAFTLPLVLYHFHQFPLSFLLTNLLAVPLSSLILYLLIALVTFSWIPFVGIILGSCSFYSIKLMNWFVLWVEQIPYSRIDNIYFSVLHTVVCMIFIVAVTTLFLKRNALALLAGLSSLLLLILLLEIQFYQTLHQQKLIVYNIPRATGIDIFNGRRYTFIGDSSLRQKNFLQNFHLLPSRIKSRVSWQENRLLDTAGFILLKLGDKQLLILDKSPDVKQFTGLQTDYLLVTKNCHTKAALLLSKLSCTTIILDGSYNTRYLSQWKNAADSLHLRLHSVQQQGAFVVNF
ncbi:MAG: ComEC/Rec2 family competence protein [Bacteroidota bacterium]